MANKIICPECQFIISDTQAEKCPSCGFVFEKKAISSGFEIDFVEDGNCEQLNLPSITGFTPPERTEPEVGGTETPGADIEINQTESKDELSDNGVSIPEDDDFTVGQSDEFDSEPLISKDDDIAVDNPDGFDSGPVIPKAEIAEDDAPQMLFTPKPKFRLVAAAIDFIAVFIVTFALWQIAISISQFKGSIFYPNSPLWLPCVLLFLIVYLTYHGWFDGLVGSSPGKAIFNLRVITKEGRSPGFLRGAFRALVGLLGMVLGGINGALILLGKRGRGIHDISFRTFVVGSEDS